MERSCGYALPANRDTSLGSRPGFTPARTEMGGAFPFRVSLEEASLFTEAILKGAHTMTPSSSAQSVNLEIKWADC